MLSRLNTEREKYLYMNQLTSVEPGKSGMIVASVRRMARNLRFQVVAVSVLLLLFVLVLTGTLLIPHFRSDLRNEARQKAAMVLQSKQYLIDEYFSDAGGMLQLFAQGAEVSQALESFNTSLAGLDTTAGSSETEQLSVRLSNYYASDYLLKLNPLLDAQVGLADYFPDSYGARYLQFHYIVNQEGADKSALETSPGDQSAYQAVHASYHRFFKNFLNQLHLDDVFLISLTDGEIVYSVSKNLEFGTNLITGPYRNTGLGEVYLQAKLAPYKEFVVFSDFFAYAPSLGKATAFAAVPVFAGDTKVGIMAIRFSVDYIDKLLYTEADQAVFGQSGRVNLVNSDYKCVNNSRFFLESPAGFFKLLDPERYDAGKQSRMKQLNSTSAILMLENDASVAALKGIAGSAMASDEFGKKVYAVYSPLKVHRKDYALVYEISTDELYKSSTFALLLLSIIAIVSLLLAGLLANQYAQGISRWLATFRESVVQLAHGRTGIRLSESRSVDELCSLEKSFNTLADRYNILNEALTQMASGRFDTQQNRTNEEDQLGRSVENLRESLIKTRDEQQQRAIEDEKRNWTSRGIAMFSDILRGNTDNIAMLSGNLVRELVAYMHVVQAGIFVAEERDDTGTYLDLTAAYAYDRQKFLKKEVLPGEGLIGTCYLEKKTIYLKEIPAQYIKITSGFGDTQPKSLLIVPIVKDDAVLGVIELSSLDEFKAHEIEFVEKLSESIGATMISARIATRTSRLLDESKLKAEEMAAQEEEMRQNLEELQATQEEMRRIKELESAKQAKLINEMEANKQLLNDILNRVPAKIFLKDHEGRFVLVNNEVADMYGVEPEKLYGTSDFDHHPAEDARIWKQEEEEIKAMGGKTFVQEEVYKGKTRYLQTTKLPFDIRTLGETGLLGIQFDVTEIKDLQNELAARFDEMEKLKLELSKESSLMKALMESVPEHIYFKDRDSRFIRISRSMVSLFKANDYNDLIGKSDFDFFGEEHARPAYEDEQNIISSEKPIIDLVEKEVHKDGSIGWVSTTKMPLRDESGQVIGTFGISKDISGLKNLELKAEEIQKQNQVLSQKLKDKEEELKTVAKLTGTNSSDKEFKTRIEELEKQNAELQAFKQLVEAYRKKLQALQRKK